MNLILALLWLLGGIAVLAYDYFTGGVPFLRIRGTDLSFGWLLLVLGAYNLARWWSLRCSRAAQQAQWMAQAQRHRAAHHRERPEDPPDPNFNFTDQPPPPADRGITDRPPSEN